MPNIGSKYLTDNFIKPKQEDSDFNTNNNIKTIYDIVPDAPEEFYKEVEYMYNICKSYISQAVIDADSDPLRSDIKVFLAVIAILSGDTREIILKWIDHIDIETTSLDEFKELIKLTGYEWVYKTMAAMSINENKQRLFAQMFASVIKHKGTEASIKSIVKYFYLDLNAVPLLGDTTVVTEDPDTHTFDYTQGVGINSDYLKFDLDDNNRPIKNVKNGYATIVKNALEFIRPAGISFRYQQSRFNLDPFDGRTYWRHSYNSSIQPFDSIKDTSIIKKDGSIYVEVTVNGSIQKVSSDYNYLIASLWIPTRTFELKDMAQIPFDEVSKLDFASDVIDNSYYPGGPAYHGLYSGSSLEVISNLSFDLLCKNRPYSLGPIEFNRS